VWIRYKDYDELTEDLLQSCLSEDNFVILDGMHLEVIDIDTGGEYPEDVLMHVIKAHVPSDDSFNRLKGKLV